MPYILACIWHISNVLFDLCCAFCSKIGLDLLNKCLDSAEQVAPVLQSYESKCASIAWMNVSTRGMIMQWPGSDYVFVAGYDKGHAFISIPLWTAPFDVTVFHGHGWAVDVAKIIFQYSHISTPEVNNIKLCLLQSTRSAKRGRGGWKTRCICKYSVLFIELEAKWKKQLKNN